MENQVNEQVVNPPTVAPSAYNSMVWDGLSVVALFGGAIASVAVQGPAGVAAGVIPVAAGVGLHIVNRRQLHEHLLANQQAANAQIIATVQQNQTAIQQYLQQLQGEMQKTLGQQQQLIETNQVNLTQALENKAQGLRGELATFQASAEQTHGAMAQAHQDLVAVVKELRQMGDCTQTIVAYPRAEAYYQRGRSHQILGDLQEAVRDFTEAIRLDGSLAGAFHHRGVVYAQLDNRKQATDDLRQAYKLYFDQGDLDNYELARSLHKEFYEGPVEDLEPEMATATPEAGGNGHEAYINEPERDIQPLLSEEDTTTAANLFG